eukprot:TRINITY_DN40632_c0_g1_i1.p1 TRINITY_DN40632_c0_g1~~TRINITY_DN40632_c0_g1_i1.p1  ORF type:complete len:311 (-),score=56.72 TRINITY_DN40632_c0_g1_i1:257-1189(-)
MAASAVRMLSSSSPLLPGAARLLASQTLIPGMAGSSARGFATRKPSPPRHARPRRAEKERRLPRDKAEKSEMSLQEVMAACASGQSWAAQSTHGDEILDHVEKVVNLYSVHGSQDVETMHLNRAQPPTATPVEIALRAAEVAQQAGADEDVIVAALLHDCGHLLGHKMPQLGGWRPDQAWRHVLLADRWMRSLGFSDRVLTLLAHQGSARRYLCYKDADYFESFPAASRPHGGSMSPEEAAVFESAEDFDAIMVLRRSCDEASTRPSGSCSGSFEQYRKLLESHLLAARSKSRLWQMRNVAGPEEKNFWQ